MKAIVVGMGVQGEKRKKILQVDETKNIILFNAAENYYDLCFAYLLSKEKKYNRKKILFYIPFFSFHKKHLNNSFINFSYLSNWLIFNYSCS